MFSLRNKLFLAFLLSSGLLVLSMLALFQWSFDRGFLNYIRQLDEKRIEAVGTALEQRLANGEDLQTLLQNRAIHDILDEFRGRPHGDRPFPDLGAPPPHPHSVPHAPPHEHMREPPPPPRLRIFVLDSNKQPLAGFYRASADNLLRPLRRGDALLGYVGVEPKKVPQDFLDRQFAATQSQNFVWMAAIAMVVSLLMAFPMASFLVQRIARLVEQVRQLSAGNYEHRIALSGNDELNQLALHLNDLGKTLQETAHSRRRMVADISHELRTPIATLRANLEAIEDGVRPLDTSSIRRLHEQVMRLSNLVNDLYELSLADVGALSYRKQTLDLRDTIADLTHSMQPQFQRAGLELTLRGALDTALPVLGDEQRLNQLFANLLQNSLQYTSAPGRVMLDIRREHNAAIITVSDSAPGVEKSVQPRLFERLFRAESSRNRNSGGAGLGLSLCQSIVQAHDGNITIADSPLGGLAVTVRIPLVHTNP